MSELETIQQQREAAEHKLATMHAKVEALQLEKAVAILESPQPVPVPWTEYPAYDDWGIPRVTPFDRPYFFTSPDDRTEGRYRPLYENEQDVRRMMAEARSLCELFPVAKGALQKLSDYIIGNGWDFLAQPKKEYKNDPTAIQLCKVIQRVVNKVLEYNNFVGVMDREIHEMSRMDGNAFPTLYREDDCIRIELTDAGCVREPMAPTPLERALGRHGRLNYWWHGIHTTYNRQLKRDDVARPLGYHAVFDNLGDQWDYLPVSRVQHIRRNVFTWARVGVTDFLSVQEDLRNEAKLRRNTAVGAAILAAIVMIRQHAEGVSQSTVERMVSGNATALLQRHNADGSSRTVNSEHVNPGTIKDAPAGMTHQLGAMGTLRSPVYIEVAQFLRRSIGNVWSMPEYLISGDASNANYASTLVAESPFVKYCESEQGRYAGHYERLVWKALKLLHDGGFIPGYAWPQICAMLEIVAQYTSPASRDKLQQIQANQTMVDMGIMSKRSAAVDMGLDYDEEKAQIGKEPKPAPPPQLMLPGNDPMGGEDFERPPVMESSDAGRWITVNGAPVLIDEDGTVQSGPLKGKQSGDGGGKPKAGEERGATAIHKGEKVRTISKRARINIDQMKDLMGERGYKVGQPKSGPKGTFYPISKGDGPEKLVSADTIKKFLTTEKMDIAESRYRPMPRLEAVAADAIKRLTERITDAV